MLALLLPMLSLRAEALMNKYERPGNVTSYEADYARWCAEQGALLRAGRLDALDRENLAEEIESLGRSDKYEIENRLEVLLLHLLKWAFQPEKQKSGWRATIVEQRIRIAKRIKESPSLRAYPAEILDDAYRLARAGAENETGLPYESFPETCPFAIDQILDKDWLPDAY
jgi:hypothetical protein